MAVRYTSHKGEVLRAVKQAKDAALEIIGGKAEDYAKDLCPVDTGTLRKSITHKQVDKNTESIGTRVKYAPYVELGTHKMTARPYLRPAVQDHATEYQQIIKQLLGSL